MSRAPMPDTVKGDAPMPSSFDDDPEFWDEGRWSKLVRRLKEEPLIPFGLALTCYALLGASRSIRRGDKTQTNMYFRARVYAQGFTLLCLCVGSMYWKEDREKRKHYQGLLAEKRAQEKREAWIKELEARDEEDRLEREKRQKRKEIRRQQALQREEEANASDNEDPESNKRGQGGLLKSSLEDEELRMCAVNAGGLLGPAMWLWRWRHQREKDDELRR